MTFRQFFLEKVIDDFKNKGYKFNHIEEMNIITIANKIDMSYFFISNKICMPLSAKYLL